MKKRCCLIVYSAILALTGQLSAQRPVAANYSRAQVKEDLAYLWQTIADVHPRLGQSEVRDRFEVEFQKTLASITSPLSEGAMYRLLAPFVAQLQDVHSVLEYRLKLEDQPLFPLDIVFVAGKAQVETNLLKDGPSLVGQELLAINGRAMDKVVKEMCGLLCGENASMKFRSLETDLFKVYHELLFPGEKEFVLRLRSEIGGENEVRLSGISRQGVAEAHRLANKNQPTDSCRLEMRDGLALLTVKSFEGKELPAFFDEAFTRMREEHADRLLIDLRDNLGGDIGNAEELLTYLLPDPEPLIRHLEIRASDAFRKQMKRRLPGLVRWLPLQNLDPIGKKIWQAKEGEMVSSQDLGPLPPKPERVRFTGPIALLINGHTISQRLFLANRLHTRRRATIFGQESGYTASGSYFQPLSFTLPNSKLPFTVASMAVVDEKGHFQTSGSGVLPDTILFPALPADGDANDSLLEQTIRLFSSRRLVALPG